MAAKKKRNTRNSIQNAKIGPRIRALRKEKEMTTAELAKAVGVYPNSLTRWETGSPIVVDYLAKVADGLGTTPQYLKTGTQPTAADVSPPPKPNGHPQSAPPPPGTTRPVTRPPGGHSVEAQLAPVNAALQHHALRDKYRNAVSTRQWSEFCDWLEASDARAATVQPWMITMMAGLVFPEGLQPTGALYRGLLKELVQCQMSGVFD